MRFPAVFVAVSMMAVPLALGQGTSQKCKVQGLHLCCKECEKTVQEILGKVKDVSDVNCDRPGKTVTFKARNEKAADEAVSALVDAGFFFKVTVGDKNYPVISKSVHIKSDPLVLHNVHACSEECEKAVQALFKDGNAVLEGKGAVKDLKLSGKEFEADAIIQKLHDAGLHGVVVEAEKKK